MKARKDTYPILIGRTPFPHQSLRQTQVALRCFGSDHLYQAGDGGRGEVLRKSIPYFQRFSGTTFFASGLMTSQYSFVIHLASIHNLAPTAFLAGGMSEAVKTPLLLIPSNSFSIAFSHTFPYTALPTPRGNCGLLSTSTRCLHW